MIYAAAKSALIKCLVSTKAVFTKVVFFLCVLGTSDGVYVLRKLERGLTRAKEGMMGRRGHGLGVGSMEE